MGPCNAFDLWPDRKLRGLFDRVAGELLPEDFVEHVRMRETKESAETTGGPARPPTRKSRKQQKKQAANVNASVTAIRRGRFGSAAGQ